MPKVRSHNLHKNYDDEEIARFYELTYEASRPDQDLDGIKDKEDSDDKTKGKEAEESMSKIMDAKATKIDEVTLRGWQEFLKEHNEGRPGFWGGVVLGSRILDGVVSVTKFGWEHNPTEEYPTPFPSVPFAHFNQYRLGLNDKQDKVLRSVEAGVAHFNNFSETFNFFSPPNLRSNGQTGYFISLGEYLLHPAHKLSLTSGLLSSQRDEPFFKASNLLYAFHETINAGKSLENGIAKTTFECSPGQDAYFDSMELNCAEEQADVANINDLAVEQAEWSSDEGESGMRDLEAVEAMAYGAYWGNVGQNTARMYQSINLWVKNTEDKDGHLTWWSATTPLLNVAEIASTTLVFGHELDAGEIAGRFALSGAALAFNGITTTPQVDAALANNGVFAVMGWTYPKIMYYYNTPYDSFAFDDNTYDQPGSVHQDLLPALSTAFYLYGHGWAGYNSGTALKLGTGAEKFGPLIQMGLGLGSQAVSNAYEGDPKFWKYLAIGSGVSAGTTALGYLMADVPWVQDAMRFNPTLSAGPDGFYAQIELGHLLARKEQSKKIEPPRGSEPAAPR